MQALILATLLCLSGSAAPQQPASQYAEGLRLQNEKAQAVTSELLEMIRQDEKDPEVIASVGRRFLTEYDGAIAVMNAYRGATTRFGTQSEVDDIMQLHLALQAGRSAVHVLVEGSPPPPFPPREINLARQAFQDDIVPLIKEFVDQQLEIQGAADFLTDPGFKQAALLLASQVGAELKSKVENEIQKVVGARIHIGMSLKEHILMMARTWVGKSLGNWVLRFAANHFIVERLGVKLLEWMGPKVREFLRPKGNLASRVDRAIAGLKVRRSDLARMDSDEDMMDVRRLVEAALSHLDANDYLRKDLTKAKEDDLYQKLAAEEKKLVEAITVTKRAFLMNSKFAQVFGEVTKDWKAGRQRTADLLETLKKTPEAAGEYDAFARQEWKAQYPGKFGLAISKQGDGFHVKVTDPQQRVAIDHFFKPDPSAPSSMYQCREAIRSDGEPLLVTLYVADRDADGSPKSGWMQWWTQKDTKGLLAIEYVKRSATSWALLYDASFSAGSKGTAKDFPGKYTIELTRAGRGLVFAIGFQGRNEVTRYPLRVRVIDPNGKVILNVVVTPSAVIEPGTSNKFIRYDGGPAAWTDGTPVPRINLHSVSGRANPHDPKDLVPNSGILYWYSDASGGAGSILFSLSFMPRKG